MYFTNEMLISGDANVLRHYQSARQRWNVILQETDYSNPSQLSQRLTNEQLWFERYCGGRGVGQEVMVITGLTIFYNTQSGYGEHYQHAFFIYQSFMQSYCSIEVKNMAQKLAQDYALVQGSSHGY
ncbi:hypothetical protein [Photobacterium phosphoreum]|uniref:hypothetical protein n=1 Tax=Photobacterium phosphoreum TaxID=659 RepID=UPI001E52AB65|nr:hypothetical protein [Photobacterium phosphoreum]MCD9473769.1 hypothetical protein [Photobacterium phosphoreum]MCF2176219.1 hypothetical protein [Photobacterium phosphoreum]